MMISLIPKAEFAMRKRDPMLDYQAYQTEAEDLLKRLPNAAKKLSDPSWLDGRDEAALLRLTYARAGYALDLISLSYSAGTGVESLRAFYPALLSYFEEYALYSEAFNRTPEGLRTQGPHIALGDVEFVDANRLLCFAILLGWQEYVPRIMAIIDYNNPLRDGMLERLSARYVERPHPLPTECLRHLPYYKTLAIFDAPADERIELMRDYLEEWYEASRREPYYDSHSKGNRFLGYWSWEAAAMTTALGIDDRLYRELAFYPRDMLDHSSGARRAAGAVAPFALETRAKAGDACPVAGTWESIGIPTQRTAYPKDAELKDLGSPYGLTVWRLLENG